MRIFISYARVDQPYIVKIIDMLDIHEVWYDQRLYAGQDWWTEILRRLDWCEAFIYVLSPASVISQYCLEEFRIAKKLNKRIIPVLIDQSTEIPEELKSVQYADLSGEWNVDAAKSLLHALYVADPFRSEAAQAVNNTQTTDIEDEYAPRFETMPPDLMIGRAVRSMENGDFDNAVFLLKQVREQGFKPDSFNLDELLRQAEQGLGEQIIERKVEVEYKSIRALVNTQTTREFGLKAFAKFRRAYPTYDPANLAQYLDNGAGSPTGASAQQTVIKSTSKASSPPKPSVKAQQNGAKEEALPLEWVDIPAGDVLIRDANGNEKAVHINRFYISKYPITNAQFESFIQDPKGYQNERWWQFSPHARQWHTHNPPRSSRFSGAARPRENVSWYEAIAFSHWLSAQLKQKVTLPTVLQWRRAARGDTRYAYPFGNEFDATRCNTLESRKQMTTPVNAYPNGASPPGVLDMAGNVWEWCLDPTPGSEYTLDITSNAPRALKGGSYRASKKYAEIDESLYLDPGYFYGTMGFRIARI